MTKTKTIQHEYGEKEIEVVECDSCGQEVAKNKAYAFLMTKGGSWIVGDNIDVDGWACEYCVENDPIDFPNPGSKWEIDTPFIVNFVLWALLAVSLLIVIL